MIAARLNALMPQSFFCEPWECVYLEHYEGTREEWLISLTHKLRPIFEAKGFPIPLKVRVSLGWPKSSKAIGVCHSSRMSEDNTTEIFISPAKSDSLDVAQILVHELIHAAVGLQEGHKGNFKRLALSFNLGGKMTATVRTPEFDKWMTPIVESLGDIPHATLNANRRYSSAPAKQGTRMIKCSCSVCGYTVRTTAKWITMMAAPHCPLHGEMRIAKS